MKKVRYFAYIYFNFPAKDWVLKQNNWLSVYQNGLTIYIHYRRTSRVRLRGRVTKELDTWTIDTGSNLGLDNFFLIIILFVYYYYYYYYYYFIWIKIKVNMIAFFSQYVIDVP